MRTRRFPRQITGQTSPTASATTGRAHRPDARSRECNHVRRMGAVLGVVADTVRPEPRRQACGSSDRSTPALSAARLIGAEVSARFAVDEARRAARVSMLVIAAGAILFLGGLFGGRPILSLTMLFVMNLFTRARCNRWCRAGSTASSSRPSHNVAVVQLDLPDDGRRSEPPVRRPIADTTGIPFAWQIAALSPSPRPRSIGRPAAARPRQQ